MGSEKALLVLLGLSLLIPGLARGEKSAASATPIPVKQLLQEVNEHFTIRGKPIHPRLVEKFQTFLSDSGPPAVVTVDLLAAARLGNEYYDDDVKRREGFLEVKKDGEDKGEFAYKWLGTVRPGLHVVETFDNGGGTGIFMDLYFFRTSIGTGQDEKGPYDQVLMTLARTPVILGDRDDGAIKVEPGRVIIGRSRYREKPVILQFK
ncbi:MAG: hypothetical protein NTY36_11405 [Deltaproteobacteria bacterium]|nr:hypothetical protein [Deltaproteobacteria bacterium]